MQMSNKNVIPNTVDNFGSKGKNRVVEEALADYDSEENLITPDNYESHADKLPRPTGYRILILPFTISRKQGGIILTKQTVEKERLSTVVGHVVALGPDAYADTIKFPEGPWCKKGDWVVFGRYAGARFQIEGGDMRLLNDDEILAVVDDPEAIIS